MTFKEYFDGINENEKAKELFNFVNKLQLTYSDKLEFLRLFKNCQQDAYEASKK